MTIIKSMLEFFSMLRTLACFLFAGGILSRSRYWNVPRCQDSKKWEIANARSLAMKKKPSSKQPLIEHYATAYDLPRSTLYKAYNALQLGMAKSAVKTWAYSQHLSWARMFVDRTLPYDYRRPAGVHMHDNCVIVLLLRCGWCLNVFTQWLFIVRFDSAPIREIVLI